MDYNIIFNFSMIKIKKKLEKIQEKILLIYRDKYYFFLL